MATPSRRLDTNATGDVYVDSTCIDCGTCRWMAPDVFDAIGSYSRVHTQPDAEGLDAALAAVVACPTGSIGTEQRHDIASVTASFPRRVDGEVYHCGFHAEASFGAAAWLVRRPEGNVLVDSPRFNAPLVRALEALGGVHTLFLTHKDDVADHDAWARRFGCERVMHAADRSADTAGVERWVDGDDPVELMPGVTVWPTPGHTKGSACLHVDDRWLFTGDTLAWSIPRQQLIAFRRACWYDWGVLQQSLRRLVALEFSSVLPGHGAPHHDTPAAMRAHLQSTIEGMG